MKKNEVFSTEILEKALKSSLEPQLSTLRTEKLLKALFELSKVI
jgi:hypothetical protein